MKNTLLTTFAKYLESEGIFCSQMQDKSSSKSVLALITCINGKFVIFDIDNSLPEVAQKRILRNGGKIYNSTTLDDFIEAVRDLEK